jgi:lipopolysaccharide biosynthesis glycosyltransferase
MKKISICTSINEEYSFALKLMLKSVLITVSNEYSLEIFILNDGINKKICADVESVCLKSKINIHWVQINKSDLNGLKIDGHISIDTYSRLLIEELVPRDKILYLDADIVVKTCISKLWNYKFNNSLLLAVPHISKESGFFGGSRGIPAYKVLNIAPETRTFNAGVMLINLKLWRNNNISKKTLKYLKKYKEYVLWWDQDGLNVILQKRWRSIPTQWNVMANHFSTIKSYEDSLISKREFDKCIKEPNIIHFAGPRKPWKNDYNGIFKDDFESLKYLSNI